MYHQSWLCIYTHAAIGWSRACWEENHWRRWPIFALGVPEASVFPDLASAGLSRASCGKRVVDCGCQCLDLYLMYWLDTSGAANCAKNALLTVLWHLCRAACEKSIADLQCQYLDLYLMHWPDAWEPGTGTPGKPDTTVTIQQTW